MIMVRARDGRERGALTRIEAPGQRVAHALEPVVTLADELGVIPWCVIYVIDRQGAVRHVFSSMANIGQHVGEAGGVTTLEASSRPDRAARAETSA